MTFGLGADRAGADHDIGGGEFIHWNSELSFLRREIERRAAPRHRRVHPWTGDAVVDFSLLSDGQQWLFA
jgi:hypothetical protein